MEYGLESPINYEQKCLCVLVVDTSGSMQGTPIDELNQGLQLFHQDISNNFSTAQRLEICLIEFNSQVDCIVEPSLIDHFDMPILAVAGTTKLVDGVRLAMHKVQERKQWYRSTGQPYYRPWIILMTDGAPDKDQDIQGLAQELQSGVVNKQFTFFPIGVQGADLNMLRRISTPDRPPMMLQGLRFEAFFDWLSASLAMVASSTDGQVINLPPTSGWGILPVS
ncbi:vWA domain-containing protein [Herpetosiphon llansteffanensis]|uniref:vWA domain-containing protein n=1 Tax=Herpetosiphon llansteffanensis TaxID=2094568 RepID=UPI000D7CDA6B|nr:VWA domain-containing protein [Herpetosiphon llansteffanensis]